MFDSWYLQSGKRTRRIEVTAPTFTIVPHLVVGTDRIATMHRRLAILLAATLPLRVFPAPFDLPRVHQVIQWHRLSETDLATLWGRDELMASLAAQG